MNCYDLLTHEPRFGSVNHIIFRQLANNGFSLIRLRPLGKEADREKGWQSYCNKYRPYEVIKCNPTENMGIAVGPASNIVVVDVDDPVLFVEWCVKNEIKELGHPRIHGTTKGFHLIYKRWKSLAEDLNRVPCVDIGIDLMLNRSQIVAPGSAVKKEDQNYLYYVVKDFSPPVAPTWLRELVNSRTIPNEPIQTNSIDLPTEKGTVAGKKLSDKLRESIVERPPQKGIRNTTLFKHLCALKGKGANEIIATSYTNFFCAKTGLSQEEGLRTLKSAWTKEANLININAKEIINQSKVKPILNLDVLDIIDGLVGDKIYVDALAIYFKDKYRYCVSNKMWYECINNIWHELGVQRHPDVSTPLEEYFQTYMSISEDVSKALKKPNLYRQSFNSINAMWQLLRQHPLMIISETEFDCNAMMVPLQNVLIELVDGSKTITVKELHWSSYIRKTLPVVWRARLGTYDLLELDRLYDKDSIRFDQMLSNIFYVNPELKLTMSKLLGYALSGTKQKLKKLPLLVGSGNNGKSVLFRCLQSSLTPLCITVDKSLVVGREIGDTSPKPELLALKGARIGFIGETEETDYLNESTVKALTGGDIRTARNLYSKDMVQLEPTYTLFLATNHEPRVASGGIALWGRILPIPFNSVFTYAPKHPHEINIQKDIWDWVSAPHFGVVIYLLRWWLIYTWEGLGELPECSKQFSEDYKEDEDPFTDFIEECLEFNKIFYLTTKETVLAYRNWCNDNQITLNHKVLSRTIKRGIEKSLLAFDVKVARLTTPTCKYTVFRGVGFKPLIADTYAKPRPIKKQI